MGAEAAIPAGFWARIQKMIDESIGRYARSGPLRNARISGGAGLTITDGGRLRADYPADIGGETMLYVGPIYSATDGTTYQGTGLLLQAPDGTDLAVFRSDAYFGTTMQNIYDSTGTIIFGNDAATGQGLARPYIPGALYPIRYADMTIASTSAVWETVLYGEIPKQHPRLEVAVRATMDTSGTTGQVRVLVGGVAMSTVADVGYLVGTAVFGPEPVAGGHMAKLQVEVQVQVTSTSGAVRVAPVYLQGRQS